MSDYEIPPYLVDPEQLPPQLMTSEPGSFARFTLEVRVPRILDETVELNLFPAPVLDALQDLRLELVSGTIRGLREDAPDVTIWNKVSEPYFGHSWLDVPWYWAEAYFYRRVLEAIGYFVPGPMQGFDPYAVTKSSEWQPDAAPRAVDTLLGSLPDMVEQAFMILLKGSLWGNRIDLSYKRVAQLGMTVSPHEGAENLLVDDSEDIWTFLRGQDGPKVAIVADNAGTELAMDMALIDLILAQEMAEQVILHVKPQPFFVSDAMESDVMACLDALDKGGDFARSLASRLRTQLQRGRLRLYTHWFYTTSLHYFQLPSDLYAELARMRLVIVKGDANYRRLFGDAHWPPTASFRNNVGYFPAQLAALRTLKSELILGLPPGTAERLRVEDPDWMVNGRRGVLQARV